MAETEQKAAPKGAKDSAEALKAALINLILTDPDVEQALRLQLGLSISDTDQPGKLGGSDAEHAAIVQDLIEQTMMRMIRPEALRRPVPVH